MNKTIKQIADELGVSKQAVYKRYKGKLYAIVAPYAHTVDGAVYISERGENIIKQDFFGVGMSDGTHTESHTDMGVGCSGAHTEYTPNHLEKLLEDKRQQIEWLKSELNQVRLDKQKEINSLHHQLDTKDEQIKNFNDRLEQSLNNQLQNNQLQQNNQLLLAQSLQSSKEENTIGQMKEDTSKQIKRNWFFWKKSNASE